MAPSLLGDAALDLRRDMSAETPRRVVTPSSLSRDTSAETPNNAAAAIPSGRVHVFCRVRPLLPAEDASCVSVDEDGGNIEVFEHDKTVENLLARSPTDSAVERRKFHFDRVF